MSCDTCEFPFSLCQCVRPRNLGNFSSLPYGGVQFTCEKCDVTWTGCAAAADCPECGDQFDWNNPSAPPIAQGDAPPLVRPCPNQPHPYDPRWIWMYGDHTRLCMVPKGWSYCGSCEFADPDRRCPSCLRTPAERAVKGHWKKLWPPA